MYCFEKKTAKIWALITLAGFLVGAIVCILLAGINFQYSSSQWTEQGWGALGALELAAIILVIILAGVGFLGMLLENRPLTIIFIILLGISAFFTLAIAIFALIGGSIKYWDESIGCNSKYLGFLEAWSSVDTYLNTVDQTLCSQDCPCYMNTTTALKYISNTTSAPYYDEMFKTTNENHAVRFENCTEAVRNATLRNYVEKNAHTNWTFRPDLFAMFWSNVERRWSCTGFCITTYFNDRTLTNSKMVKYLYNDIGSGIPPYIGCLPIILDWLPATLNAYGSIGIAVFVLEALSLFFAICLICHLFHKSNEMISEGAPKDDMKPSNEKNMEMVKQPQNQGQVQGNQNTEIKPFKPTDSMAGESSQAENVFQPSTNQPQ